jgi:hypothetical protein
MIRRIEIDLLRSIRLASKKSAHKMFMGGSFVAVALLVVPKADCAELDKSSRGSSASQSGTSGGRNGAGWYTVVCSVAAGTFDNSLL